jgi:uncharacterized tellurite resistance protein B-like protein
VEPASQNVLGWRVTWRLEPDALAVLRETLIARGRLGKRAPSTDGSAATDAGNARSGDDDGSAREALGAEALLQRLTPFFELLYLMMSADGTCHEHERQLLRGAVRTLMGGDLPRPTVERLLADFDAHLHAEGATGRLESIASALSADRLDAEFAFTLTATMAVADGDVEDREHAVSSHLAEVLGISAGRARELVAQRPVTARRRRGP